MDYNSNYLSAYNELKASAIRKMKAYGKDLDVYNILRHRVLDSDDFRGKTDIDETEVNDALHEMMAECSRACIFTGNHGWIHEVTVMCVRYSEQTEDLEVYLETDEGDVSDWFDIGYVTYEREAVYLTVHDFIGDEPVESVWLVKHESNVDGQHLYNVTPCKDMKTAQGVMMQEVRTLLNSGHYMAVIDRKDDFKVEQTDTSYFIQDTVDDYWEDLDIEEKKII